MAISLAESLHLGILDILMRKVRSAVTIIGIVLGVMCIMVVLAIVNGMNKSTMAWMSERGGLNKVEVRQNWNYDFSKGGDASFSLKEIRYIRSMVPEATAFNASVPLQESELQNGSIGYVSRVLGVYPDMVKSEDWAIGSGRFINDLDIENNNNVIVLGSTTAQELFSSRDPLGKYLALKGQKLMVVGVLERKYLKAQGGGSAFGDNGLEYLNKQAFIPLSTLLSKIEPGQKIGNLEIMASSPEQAKVLSKKLDNIILNLKQGKQLFSVDSAQAQMEQMKQNTMIFSAIFILIAVISLLVGGIVIMNIMLASIKERTREIGVRIAVGARSRDIFIQFLVQTLLITSLGGVIGILLGYGILDLVAAFLNLEVAASLQMIWMALAVSMSVGLLFGIMPAVRASKLDPIEALREE